MRKFHQLLDWLFPNRKLLTAYCVICRRCWVKAEMTPLGDGSWVCNEPQDCTAEYVKREAW